VHAHAVDDEASWSINGCAELHIDAIGLGVGRESRHNIRHQLQNVVRLLVQFVLPWIGGGGKMMIATLSTSYSSEWVWVESGYNAIQIVLPGLVGG
jgi:hypothetical protein